MDWYDALLTGCTIVNPTGVHTSSINPLQLLSTPSQISVAPGLMFALLSLQSFPPQEFKKYPSLSSSLQTVNVAEFESVYTKPSILKPFTFVVAVLEPT